MKVRELFTDESKWSQFAFARNKYGGRVDLDDPYAYSFCIIGAIRHCYPNELASDIKTKIVRLIGDERLLRWNDTSKFSEIKKVVEFLDI